MGSGGSLANMLADFPNNPAIANLLVIISCKLKTVYLRHTRVWVIVKSGAPVTTMDSARAMAQYFLWTKK
jgi:hypothetical protein